MTGWTIPIEQQREYLAACEHAATDDEAFRAFRGTASLHAIWGHIVESEGREYFDAIMKEGRIPRSTMDCIVKMNNIGNPPVFNFDGMEMSPTAFRYLYVVSGLLGLPRSPMSIVEVGGGYGGLAATAMKFLDVKDYTIIDFHEVGLLQQRYLQECGFENVTFENATTLRAETFECHLKDSYDVFISNYAFDELNEESQERYMTIVNRCRHGYVTVNAGKDRLRELLPCTETHPEPGECHPEVMRW